MRPAVRGDGDSAVPRTLPPVAAAVVTTATNSRGVVRSKPLLDFCVAFLTDFSSLFGVSLGDRLSLLMVMVGSRAVPFSPF